MTDLRSRFRTFDELRAPELWHEVESRAAAAQTREVHVHPWVFVALVVLLGLVIGAAALVGSQIVRPLTTVEAISSPSTPAVAATSLPTRVVATTPTWTATRSMLDSRSNHTATLLSDGRVLVAGGINGSTKLASAELYDPRSGSWTATGSMLEARSSHTATLLADGKVLVVSGAPVAPGGSSFDQHAELYDPETGTWSATGGLHFAFLSRPTATLLADGRVLLMGSVYDPDTGTWRATQGMAEQGHGYAATRLPDGTVLVAGGADGTVLVAGEPRDQALASAQLFDPATRTWTSTGSLRESRAYGVATLLLDGTVLVAGGLGTGLFDPLASTELFDPATRSWAATANMDMARGRRGTFTLLQDGTVLAVGGAGALAPAAELYDPVSGKWTVTASMDSGLVDHTATLLADGTVLVVGGSTSTDAAGNPIPMASADVYDPGRGS